MPQPKKYMNPYLAGFLLGMVLLLTIYATGRGLGASGALKSVIVSTASSLSTEKVESNVFYKEYAESHPDGPLRDWLFFEVIGVFVGAFFSGVVSNRVALKLEKGPATTDFIRIGAAIVGGALFGFGSQLGRGCTSGSALSGMAVMSLGGIITMMAIFGMAYAVAYFVRKLWLK